MGSRIDKFVRKRQAVKADRSTELGIAGHEAAMKALGHAAGGWKRTADDPNIGPKLKDRASIAYTDTPARKNDSFFEPGKGNLDVIPSTLFGKPRVTSLSKPGSHTYSFETEEELNSDKRKKERARSATEAELKAVDPAQY